METLILNSELQDQFFNIEEEGSACWRNRDWSGLKNKMLEAWAIIPDPKLQYDMSYSAAWMICEALLQLRDFELSKEWIENHNKADVNRIDSGEREFMEGRFLFAQGLMKDAKSKFQIAYQKSNGRLFKSGTNNEHENYFNDYKKLLDKQIIRPTELDDLIEVSLKEIQNQNYPYALSLLYDAFNLDQANSNVQFNKGLCHYELNEPDHAADSFTRAYMLEGGGIFKEQNPKYFEFLKTKIEIK